MCLDRCVAKFFDVNVKVGSDSRISGDHEDFENSGTSGKGGTEQRADFEQVSEHMQQQAAGKQAAGGGGFGFGM